MWGQQCRMLRRPWIRTCLSNFVERRELLSHCLQYDQLGWPRHRILIHLVPSHLIGLSGHLHLHQRESIHCRWLHQFLRYAHVGFDICIQYFHLG